MGGSGMATKAILRITLDHYQNKSTYHIRQSLPYLKAEMTPNTVEEKEDILRTIHVDGTTKGAESVSWLKTRTEL